MTWNPIRMRLPPAVLQAVNTALLLLVFVVFNEGVERTTHLAASNYLQPFPAIEFFRQLGWPLSLLIVGGAFGLARYGHLLAPWDNIEAGDKLRVFVLVLAATIAWPLVTAGYNYYFDQDYALEKLLLVALLPLVWWRPLFIYPLIAVAYLLLWQLVEPSLGGTILPHKLQLLRALTLVAAAFFVHAVTGGRSLHALLVLLCCFVAAAYWLPAVAKLKLAWLGENDLRLVPLSAYAHGWLAFLPVDRIVEISGRMVPFNAFMKFFVIVAEGLCLAFLLRRWLSIGLLAAVIVFHLGVFAIYGFLFWTWIMLDIALLLLLLRTTGTNGVTIFNWPTFAVSVVLIAFSASWAKPPKLGWYDTPLTYTYRVEAYDERGQGLHVHPGYFAPYDDVFTMSSFAYLVPERAVLVGPYGVTVDGELLHELTSAADAAGILALENNSDLIRYDAARAARLQEFLQRFIANRAARGEPAAWLRALRAPQQFWSFRGEHPNAAEIVEIALVEVTTYFDGERLEDIRQLELMRSPARANVR